MSDNSDIGSLFNGEVKLNKYKIKRYVRCPDSNKQNYNQPIKYDLKSHQDKLACYHQAYIVVKGNIKSTTNTALTADANIALKNGSNSIVEKCTVRIQNNDVDTSRENYITMTVLNLLEYSDDYAKSIAESYGFAKDNKATVVDNTGHTKRKLFLGAFATDKFPVTIKLPLAYMSVFFRRLDFPLINHSIELEWIPRTKPCLLRPGAKPASELTIESTELILPIVELPPEYESKFYAKLKDKSFKAPLIWNKVTPKEIANFSTGEVNYEIESTIVGLRGLYVLAIPEANWNNQTNIETFTDATLSNINIEIDGEPFYAQDINDDELAYELLKECMNHGAADYDKGCTLSYLEWKSTYKIYGFDLSRQAVLIKDPKKSQSLRFKCELPAGNHKVFFMVMTEKTSIFDLTNPESFKTI